MPFVNIKLTDDGVTRAQKEEIIKRVTDVLVDVLDKDPTYTHVVIEEISTDNWGVHGKSVTSLRENS